MTESHLERYRLERKIGSKGGFGDVWLATDTLLERPVAVKCPKIAHDPAQRERFLAEARVLARLNHPNITQIHDAFFDEAEGRFYLVMEYVDGKDLARIIQGGTPLPIDWVLDVAKGVLRALSYVHDQGMVHRDVKPANVMIEDDVKLTDFGLARLKSILEGQTDFIAGTVAYMAPEQISLQAIDGRADLYALGIILFEMLSGGRLPFEYADEIEMLNAHLHAEPPPISQFAPAVHPLLEQAIMRLLAKDPENRYPSAEAAMEVLSAIHVGPRLSNLPVSLTPFVGREAVLAEIAERLGDPDCRLLTLVGPGGSGKTRLALEAAAGQLENYAHGVFFVNLAPLQSVDAIVPTMAEALGFTFYTDAGGGAEVEPKQQLLDYLRQKNTLLIMDNYEHLLDGSHPARRDGVGLVTDVLQTAPEVKILSTSRARLNVRGEHLFPIGGMDLPESPPEAVMDATHYSAVKLFVTSAQRVQPDFEPMADNLTDVVRICHLVDGMPLGIEIAASWVDMLTLSDIASEIRRSLDFLETEWRDVPSRHRSMRAVFDATWRRLSQVEQDAFVQLTVFRGGFTRKAARRVMASGDASGTTLRTLATLVDKSLLRYDKTHGRYEMHELLRQYGSAKLAKDPELESAVLDRHSLFYCSALQGWEADLKGSRQLATLQEMEIETENLRAAWEREVAQRRVTCLDRTINGLCHSYWRLFRYDEGEAACRLAAETLTNEITKSVLAGVSTSATVEGVDPSEASTETQRVLAKALAWQSFFLQLSGRGVSTKPLLEHSLELLSNPDLNEQVTRWERAFLLWVMGQGAVPDWERARQLHEQSLALFRVLGDEWWTSCVLRALGRANERCGDLDQARRLHRESLALNQALGDPWATAYALEDLSRLAKHSGDYETAKRRLKQGLELSQAQGYQWSAARLLIRRAWLAFMQGAFEAGADFLQRARIIHQEIGDRYALAQTLTHLGTAHSLLGQFAEARSLMEQGLELASEVGDRASMAWIPSELGEVHAFAGHYREARNLTQMVFSVARHAFDAREITARCYRVLGWAALAKESYAEAQEWLEKSVSTYRTSEHYLTREWMTFSLAALGRAAHGLGDREAAQAHLVEGLRIALEMKNFIPLVFVIPMVPLLLADRGQKERAVEIYALAASQPFVSTSPLYEEIAGRHIAALTATLPPDVVAAAQERGRARDLWTTAEELLLELEEEGTASTASPPR